MKEVLAIFTLSFFAFLFLFGSTGSNIQDISREPAFRVCRDLNESCRSRSDCCSYECNQNRCVPRTISRGLNGEHCQLDSQCVSRYCGGERKCAPTTRFKSNVGEYCLNDSGCTSGLCDNKLKICRGSQYQKAYVGQYCQTNYECRSGHCLIKLHGNQVLRCLGSSYDYAMYDELCTFDQQCASHYCDKSIYRCR